MVPMSVNKGLSLIFHLSSVSMFQNLGALFVKFTGAFITYLLMIYLSRYFGNAWLGHFSFLLSYSPVFILVMKAGTDIYLMKHASRYEANGSNGMARFLYFRLLKYHLLAGALITLVGVLLTPYLITHYLPRYPHVRFFQISIISVFWINLFILNYEFLRGEKQLLAYTFYSTVSIFFFTLLFLLLQRLMGIQYDQQIAWSYLVAAILSFIISFVHVMKMIARMPSESIPGFRLPEVLKQSFPFFANNTVFVLLGSIDVFILSKYVNPQEIGEYALMVKIATFVSFPLLVLSANFAPKLAAATEPRQLQQSISRMTRWIALASLFIFFSIFGALDLLKDFLNIRQSGSSLIYVIISMGYLFSSVCAMNEVCLLMLGHEKLYQKIMIITLLINFLFNLLLIPVFKELGAAITQLLTLVFWNLAAVYFVKRKLHLSTALTINIKK